MSGRTRGAGMRRGVSDDEDVVTTELLTDLGGIVGAAVRVSAGDARVPAAILIGCGEPILTLNDGVIGSRGQGDAVLWAIARVRDGIAGFFFMRTA